MGRQRTDVAAALLAGLLLVAATGRATEDTTSTRNPEVVNKAARQVLARQAFDGAIMMTTASATQNRIIPYFSNLAAVGLVEASRHTGKKEYLQASRRWLDWHVAHMNPDGTVWDRVVVDGQTSSTGTCDSTDACAAMFVDAVARYSEVAGPSPAQELFPAVERAVAAIRLTMNPDGLTWAKPGHKIKYLMDNVEVYRGLVAASRLARSAKKPGLSADWRNLAEQTHAGIEKTFWLTDRGHYAWALDEAGKLETRAEQWYPDVMAQLMAVAWLPPNSSLRELFASIWDARGELPEIPASGRDMEILCWFGMAAWSAGDATALRTVRERMAAFDLDGTALDSPAAYGHIIRVFSAK